MATHICCFLKVISVFLPVSMGKQKESEFCVLSPAQELHLQVMFKCF